MKKNNYLFAIIALLASVLLLGQVQAQSAFTTGYNAKVTNIADETSKNVGLVVDVRGTIDTTGGINSLTSNPFQLADYNKYINSYPLQIHTELSGGTASTQKITAVLWGSMTKTGTYVALDTISLADSSTTALKKTSNLNGRVRPWYKLIISKATGNIDTQFIYQIYAYKRD